MSDTRASIIRYIDYITFFFLVIFLLSISNSIFVNQLGYYAALVLILVKISITRKNQFSKTGLEFALGWYILALILATSFSSEFSSSFHNFLKRIFLIPIIYTVIASITSLENAKKVFIIYIGGTLVTVLIYLYFSSKYFIKGLYGIYESGPSIFQYPITASEIISFTVIYLFAFLINEKTTLKNKIFIFIGFGLSALALFSTYKRTGWMGAAFGIFLILVIKKQWKIIFALIFLFVIFLLTQHNISNVNIYNLTNDGLKLQTSIPTDGKANEIFRTDENLIVSDYNNGLLVYKDSVLQKQINLPYAVIGFYPWKDSFYAASLADSRFILMKNQSNQFKMLDEFYSPGYTVDYAAANGYFYILDTDSGLTIFTDPLNFNHKLRYQSIEKQLFLFVDSTFMVLAYPDSGYLIYKVQNGLPEFTPIIAEKKKFSFISYHNSNLFLENDEGLNLFKIDSLRIVHLQSIKEIQSVALMDYDKSQYILSTRAGELYLLNKSEEDKLIVSHKIDIGFSPQSLKLKENMVYLTQVESKQSRLLGIFDPYHQSNFTRIALWQAGIKIFMDHPLFGVGDIDLANYYKLYKKPYHKEIQGHLHNNFFHVLATLGLFGFLAVLFLFIKIILIDIKVIKQVKDTPFVSSYAIGTLAAFCGFLISGLTELNFWDHEITTLIWFTFGLNVKFFKLSKAEIKH